MNTEEMTDEEILEIHNILQEISLDICWNQNEHGRDDG